MKLLLSLVLLFLAFSVVLVFVVLSGLHGVVVGVIVVGVFVGVVFDVLLGLDGVATELKLAICHSQVTKKHPRRSLFL